VGPGAVVNTTHELPPPLELTTGVVARSQQDSARRLSLADDVTSRRRRQNSVLSDQQLLDAIRSSELGDYLHDLLVVVASVAADDQERILSSLGDALQQGRNEVLGVVRLLEDDDFLAETGAVVIDQLLLCISFVLDVYSRSRLLALCLRAGN
jgi:hypothetical protein